MALLTTAQVREHVESDLGDDAFGRVVDGADAEIVRRLGALATQTELLEGGSRYLHLGRKASAVSAAVERYPAVGGGYTETDLEDDDFSLLGDGRRVERLADGTNEAATWQGLVTVTYVPADAASAERGVLLVNLVKLELAYSGLSSDGVGDVRSQAYADHAAAKDALFRPLKGAGRRLLS